MPDTFPSGFSDEMTPPNLGANSRCPLRLRMNHETFEHQLCIRSLDFQRVTVK
jgi:hypothetical protein